MGAVFLGTPAAAVPSLTALADVENVDLVITRPPRRAGRGGTVTESPVMTAAQQFGFAVATPETIEELEEIISSGHFLFGVIVAYGRILTPSMLAAVEYGVLNLHFSLLPRWRGAAPVERAIAAGDDKTGVTLMKVDEGMDTGPILGEIVTPIGTDETGGSLTARLSFLGASLIDSTVPEYLSGHRRPVPQITTGVTHAKKLTKSEARLESTLTAEQAERTIRAYQPRPVAWVETPHGSLRIHSAWPSEAAVTVGEISLVDGEVVAGFEDGAVRLDVVQPAGKPRVPAEAWMHGRRDEPVSF